MNDLNLNSLFADQVARLCYEKFEKLPKTGKPVNDEWTHLAAIVKYCNGKLDVISIATGSKCIGKSKLSPSGDVINDSHAEVLARRGFLKYLYEQIKCMKLKRRSEVLAETGDELRFCVIPSVTFHLFSSHMPCGDAAIFPKTTALNVTNECTANEIAKSNSKNCKEDHDYSCKRRKTEIAVSQNFEMGDVIVDIHRTGAKCLPEEVNPDPKHAGLDYHVVGRVRTKPGRGDPTLSMSCSDKILRWNCVGIQGALLSLMLDPIYLSSIIISNNETLYSQEALSRAVISRNAEVAKISRRLFLLHSNLEFKHCKRFYENSAKPAPCGILWCNVPPNNHEVIVDGRRLGWTKKTCSRVKPVSVTKKIFLDTFKSVNENKFIDSTYHDLKLKATTYQDAWKSVKMALGIWTEKNTNLIRFK